MCIIYLVVLGVNQGQGEYAGHIFMFFILLPAQDDLIVRLSKRGLHQQKKITFRLIQQTQQGLPGDGCSYFTTSITTHTIYHAGNHKISFAYPFCNKGILVIAAYFSGIGYSKIIFIHSYWSNF
ncbi:hypothetical protein D3C87_1473080 [compost metagenome]